MHASFWGLARCRTPTILKFGYEEHPSSLCILRCTNQNNHPRVKISDSWFMVLFIEDKTIKGCSSMRTKKLFIHACSMKSQHVYIIIVDKVILKHEPSPNTNKGTNKQKKNTQVSVSCETLTLDQSCILKCKIQTNHPTIMRTP